MQAPIAQDGVRRQADAILGKGAKKFLKPRGGDGTMLHEIANRVLTQTL